MTWEVQIDGRSLSVELRREGGGLQVRVDDGPWRRVDVEEVGPHQLSMILDGRSLDVGLAPDGADGLAVDLLGVHYACRVLDPRRKAFRLAGGAGEGTVRTTMPGRVVRVLVEPGRAVQAGTTVVVVEAMKMENELKAPVDGTVAEVLVAAGDTVDAGAALVRIEGSG